MDRGILTGDLPLGTDGERRQGQTRKIFLLWGEKWKQKEEIGLFSGFAT